MSLIQRLISESKLLVRHLRNALRRLVQSPPAAINTDGIVKGPSVVPDWFEATLAEVSSFEPQLAQRYVSIDSFGERRVPAQSAVGKAYFQIAARLDGTPRPSHVIVAPWVTIGGADESVIQFCQMLETGADVLLILTVPSDNQWLYRLPTGVSVLDISGELVSMGEAEQELLFARLINQIAPTCLHIVNSDVAWRSLVRYGQSIHSQTKVFVSLFCDEIGQEDEPYGYAQWYLRDAHESIDAILVDNMQFPIVWADRLGVPPEKFQYVPLYIGLPNTFVDVEPHIRPRILWMGRHTRQKQPGIVREIAQALPSFDFHMYGVSGVTLNYEGSMPTNLFTHDPVSDFEMVSPQDYDAFLNTSLWDGLPFVLKQAASFRLPIVSSAVGGIPTLLDESNSYLVHDATSVDEYVHSLKRLLNESTLTNQYVECCYNVLARGHSRAVAESRLRSIGYMPDYH